MIVAGERELRTTSVGTRQSLARHHLRVDQERRSVPMDGGWNADRRIAYAAAVSTADGVVCMGGNDGHQTLAEVFVLTWDPAREKITRVEYPPLPRPCAYAQAALVGHTIYLAGGQSGEDLDSAQELLGVGFVAEAGLHEHFIWQELEAWPGVSRAFNITVHQHNGQEDCAFT